MKSGSIARRAVAAMATTAMLTAPIAALPPAASAAPAVASAVAPAPDGWPEFVYQGVITDKSQMQYNPRDEYIFPSTFHAGAYLDEPLGEWYLYFAPHDPPGGIVLMYADDIEGPWTEYTGNPVIANDWAPHYNVSHVSSPDAVWNEEAGEVFLYFHGENSTTRYATSTDGVSFEYGGVAVTNAMGGPNVTESSYARVFEHPDPDSEYAYGMFYMGNERDDIRRIRLAESVDGRTWTVDPDYVVEPGEEEGKNVSSGDLWEWNDQLYVVYHASSGKSYARPIDATLRDVADEPIVLHEASGRDDDNGRIAAPEIVTTNGETYLFYESGDRLGATIAWAKDGGEFPVTPPFGDFPADPDNPVFEQCAAPGSDEFEGALADVWDRTLREGDARHDVVDGALVVPTYAGGVAAAPLLQQELPDGSWQVTTKVTIDPTQTFQQAGLLLWASDTHYAKLDLGRATPGRSVELVYHRDGTNRQDTAAPEIAGTSTMWLRLTSDGSAIRASVSYDGESFARYGRDIPVESSGFTHVGPYAFRGTTSAPEIAATFDWFRLSPTSDAYAECLDGGTAPGDDETAAPAPGVLSSTQGWAHGLRDGHFDLRWDMWWGANASELQIYENGELLAVERLSAAGPTAQTVSIPVEGRPNGTYVYTAQAVNSQGVTAVAPLTVTVVDAAPARAALSSDNGDGRADFTLTADVWWGTNASTWTLLRDGEEVGAGELEVGTPWAQRIRIPLQDEPVGAHEYTVRLANEHGVTDTQPLRIEVKPGR